MPALITHHLFGEKSAALLPEGIIRNQEDLLAFILGNQGPDPFFTRFSTTPETASACHRLAHLMHERKVIPALMALRDGVAHLPEADKGIGRSFTLGLLGHFVLDSTTHPFIYAQQYAICGAGVGLEHRGSEVHAIIESDIDTWMLWSMRHQTVRDTPTASLLTRTERIDRVAGALFSQLALQTFDIKLNPEQYAGATRDYATLYRAIEPVGSRKSAAVVAIEHLFSSYGMAESMAHRVSTSDDCASANLQHRPWSDPATGEVRDESFPDLFFGALDQWADVAQTYVRGDERLLRAAVGNRNYNGMPTED